MLELPSCRSCGSAEYFTKGAVEILDALGCVEHLCFGSESGDAAACQTLGRILAREPEEFQESLKKNLKEGLSFPAARKKALTVYLETIPQKTARPIFWKCFVCWTAPTIFWELNTARPSPC